MPILTAAPVPPAAPVVAFIPAQDGITVTVSGGGTDAPPGGRVVAWAQVSDPAAPGGLRLDPVFLAGGRVWTPDQVRAAYGTCTTLTITAP